MSGTRAKPWLPSVNQTERNNRAAVLDAPHATTMVDVWCMTTGPTVAAIKRHARAIVAAVRAYRETK